MLKTFSFADEAKKADSASYLKLKEGDNKVRIATEFVLHESTFRDKVTGEEKKTKKFVGFVLDRADGKFKSAFLAKTIVDKIADLQLSDDYRFDGVPMPYDVNIRAKNAGTIDVDYNVLPVPPSPLTEGQLSELGQLDVADFIAKLAEEQSPKAEPSAASGGTPDSPQGGAGDIGVADIPI